jgi:hypothetical protein
MHFLASPIAAALVNSMLFRSCQARLTLNRSGSCAADWPASVRRKVRDW